MWVDKTLINWQLWRQTQTEPTPGLALLINLFENV